MYSVVLATMMTLTPAAPDWHGGCHGCYGSVNAFSYSCCGSCCGYYGYGCCGYYGSCCGYSYSCCGYSCCGYGCCGYSYYYYPAPVYYYYYPSCCGGTVITAPPAKAPEKSKLPKPTEETKKEKEVSQVIIKAPADVRVQVDGQALPLQGATQTFETPVLEQGRAYSYVFRAEGKRDGNVVVRERKVTVRAGEVVQVDFSDLYAKAAAHVTIVLPADAKLIVEDIAYPQGAGKRTFDTPQLDAGRRYNYTMRAEVVRDGHTVTQEKRVAVEAGMDVTVEFKELPVQAAQR